MTLRTYFAKHTPSDTELPTFAGEVSDGFSLRETKVPCPVHGRTRAVLCATGHLGYRCCGRKVEE